VEGVSVSEPLYFYACDSTCPSVCYVISYAIGLFREDFLIFLN